MRTSAYVIEPRPTTAIPQLYMKFTIVADRLSLWSMGHSPRLQSTRFMARLNVSSTVKEGNLDEQIP